MKRILTAAMLTALMAGAPTAARAHDAYDDSQSHPLRIIGYALHPVGYALEWVVFRPIHFVVSQPSLERIFGHTPHESSYGTYEAYQPTEEAASTNDRID